MNIWLRDEILLHVLVKLSMVHLCFTLSTAYLHHIVEEDFVNMARQKTNKQTNNRLINAE